MKSNVFPDITFIDADSSGAKNDVEFGYILVEIEDSEEYISIESSISNFIAIADNIDKFEKLGIKLDYDIIMDNEFLNELYSYYDKQSMTHR